MKIQVDTENLFFSSYSLRGGIRERGKDRGNLDFKAKIHIFNETDAD